MPKALVAISDKLALHCEALQRFSFERCLVPSDVIKNVRFENEEASVDPSFTGARFFSKVPNQITLKLQTPKTSNWGDGCDGRQFAMATMTLQKLRNVD